MLKRVCINGFFFAGACRKDAYFCRKEKHFSRDVVKLRRIERRYFFTARRLRVTLLFNE
ncbi:conserved hypothetical protein [delta proteobacterium NaphS2]|nr:conserved hypothetical protein [delta proteobacterium NaphS2]